MKKKILLAAVLLLPTLSAAQTFPPDTPGAGPPEAHATSHEDGGSDELDLTGLTDIAQGSTSTALTDATATPFAEITIPQTIATNYKGGQVNYTIYCDDTTNQAVQQGIVSFSCHNIAGTEACGFSVPAGVTLSDGTADLATPVFTAAAGADLVNLEVASDCTGVTPSTHTIEWRLDMPTLAAVQETP